MDKVELIKLIRSRIATGALPENCVERRIFAGKGDGQTCACCGLQISSNQVQYDVECLGSALADRPVPMHLQCFTLWIAVSDAAPGAGSPDAPRMLLSLP